MKKRENEQITDAKLKKILLIFAILWYAILAVIFSIAFIKEWLLSILIFIATPIASVIFSLVSVSLIAIFKKWEI